jgi:outer membrane protein OmpA-like peptidoglycan-associated protein
MSTQAHAMMLAQVRIDLMKSHTCLSLCFGLALGACFLEKPQAFAQTPSRISAPALRISPYARQVGMGEAFTALANDNVNAMRYNIGGMGTLRNILLSAHFHQWIADTQEGALEGALPTKYGVFGLSFTYFDEGELIELDDSFVNTGTVFSNNDLVLALGYSNYFRLFNNNMALGLAVKGVRQNLANEAGDAVGLDAGLLYTLKYVSIGATLQNFTLKKMKFKNGVTEYKLPETIRGGLATRLPLGEQLKLNLGVDGAKYLDSFDKNIRISSGAELLISEVFAVRGGYKFHDYELSKWGAGFGVNIPTSWLGGASTSFDYAYSPLEDFDSQAHRFSVTFNFGTLVPAPLVANAEEVQRLSDEARQALLDAQEAEARLRDTEERMSELEKLLAERLEKAKQIAESTKGEIEVTEQADRNVLATLRVNFDWDKSDIRPDMYETLNKLSEILNTYPESQVWIAGHTDNTGDDEYNFHLAERRMDSVMNYLTRRGLSSSRFVDPIPYGEWRPLDENRTPELRFRNRRVEFLIYTGVTKPELHPGSKIESVAVLNDSVSVQGNGRLDFSARFVDDPPRVVLVFPKTYVPDAKTFPINRGTIRQARVGFHPEDGSTWVVLDLNSPVTPRAIAAGKRVNIDTGSIAVKETPK